MRAIRCGSLLVLLCVTAALAAPPAVNPAYLYQYSYFGPQGWVSLESETAYGTREASLYGTQTWEQALRLRVAAADWLTFDAAGNALFLSQNDSGIQGVDEDQDVTQDEDVRYGASVDANFKVLSQERYPLELGLGVGYLHDYQGTSIPRVRLMLGRNWGRLNLMASGLTEYPIAAKEVEVEHEQDGEVEIERETAYDKVDVIVSSGLSYAASEMFRLGIETVVQDIEGFWDKTEAEGGAKLIAGPTAAGSFMDNRVHLRLNAGVLAPLTYNDPTRVPDSDYQNRTGFIGRLAFGFSF